MLDHIPPFFFKSSFSIRCDTKQTRAQKVFIFNHLQIKSFHYLQLTLIVFVPNFV